MTLLLPLAAGLLGLAAGSPGPPRIIDPATYLSPTQTWRLHVDPDHRNGFQGSTLRVDRRVGEDWLEDWSRHVPFTLWEAAVGDDGVVAGHGRFQAEVDGRSRRHLWIGALGPDGQELWSEQHPIGIGDYPDSWAPGAGFPAILADPPRLVLWMTRRKAEGGSGWRSLDLRDGSEGPAFDLEDPAPMDIASYDRIHRIQALPGGRHLLARWSYQGNTDLRHDEEEVGAVVSIHGADGARLWDQRWPGAGRRDEQDGRRFDGLSDWVLANGLLVHVDPELELEVLDVEASAYLRLVVDLSDGACRVVEAGRREVDLRRPEPPPTRALELLARVRLAGPDLADVGWRERQVSVGIHGRLLVRDPGATEVRVHAVNGELVELLAPPPGREFLRLFPLQAPEGETLLQLIATKAEGEAKVYARFGPGGELLGTVSFELDPRHLDPSGAGSWSSQPFQADVVRVDVDGEVTRCIERNATGRWARGRFQIALDEAGCAVLRDGEQGGFLLLDATGETTGFLPAPGTPAPWRLDAAGDWILQDSGKSGVFLVRRSGDVLVRVDLPEEQAVEGASSWVLALSPTGDELWALGRHHLEFLRFALPD